MRIRNGQLIPGSISRAAHRCFKIEQGIKIQKKILRKRGVDCDHFLQGIFQIYRWHSSHILILSLEQSLHSRSDTVVSMKMRILLFIFDSAPVKRSPGHPERHPQLQRVSQSPPTDELLAFYYFSFIALPLSRRQEESLPRSNIKFAGFAWLSCPALCPSQTRALSRQHFGSATRYLAVC